MKKIIGKIIWNFAETYHISLRGLAPIIFSWMIRRKSKRIK